VADRSAILRALPEPNLRVTRDELDLGKWLRDSKPRREKYFRLIDETRQRFEAALGTGLSDGSLRNLVSIVLQQDDTYLRFLVDQAGPAEVRDPDKLPDLYTAGAGTVLSQYLTAREAVPA